MNECRRIEPLLHLYRDGELTDVERSKVGEHVQTCSRCKAILRDLLSMDAILVPSRETIPDLPADAQIAERVLARIAPHSAGSGVKTRNTLLAGEMLSWMRPALSVAVLVAVAFLVVQQTRDAIMIATLENRLKAHGDVAMQEMSLMSRVGPLLANAASIEERKRTSFSSPVPNTAIAEDPLQVLGRGIMGLFHRQSGLLEELSQRYPGLSTVTLDDGIDDRERKILNTEGKAFLKELEQLIREGEKEP